MRPVVAPLALVAQGLSEEGYDILDLALSEDPRAEVDRYFPLNSPTAVGITVRNTDDRYYLSGDFVLREKRRLSEGSG